MRNSDDMGMPPPFAEERLRCPGLTARVERLEAALRTITATTYGTELHDTDAERADRYWTHLQRFQTIAREALGS